jgi:hypothetical protein
MCAAANNSHMRKPRGRPRINATSLLVTLPPDELAALDEWITERGATLNRQQALRIRAGLKAERAPAGPPGKPPTVVTPSLKWKRLKSSWVATWNCAPAIAARGFKPTVARLWSGVKPSSDDWANIEFQIARLRFQMLQWDRERKTGTGVRVPSHRVWQNRANAERVPPKVAIKP